MENKKSNKIKYTILRRIRHFDGDALEGFQNHFRGHNGTAQVKENCHAVVPIICLWKSASTGNLLPSKWLL